MVYSVILYARGRYRLIYCRRGAARPLLYVSGAAGVAGVAGAARPGVQRCGRPALQARAVIVSADPPRIK